MTRKNWLLYILALVLCFVLGCAATLGLYLWDHQTIRPLSGGQVWDLSAFGFSLRVPEDAALADHSLENARQGGRALFAGSASGKDGTLYLFCYENETGDRLEDYPDQDVVSYYMAAGASSVRTRMLGGHKFVCYRAQVLTEDGPQTWDTYETWNETLQVTFETQMEERAVLPLLDTIEFTAE